MKCIAWKWHSSVQTHWIVIRRIVVLTAAVCHVASLALWAGWTIVKQCWSPAQWSPCQLCCHAAAAGAVRRSPIQMNHKVPVAGAWASEQTNRITSLGTQNQLDFHVAIRVTSLCVSFYLLRYTDVSAFVSVLFAGQTIGRLVKQVAVRRDGSSSLPSSSELLHRSELSWAE